MLNGLLEDVQRSVDEGLDRTELHATAREMDALGIDDDTCVSLLRGVTEAPASLQRIRSLRAQLARRPEPGCLERILLLRAWRRSLERLPALTVDDSVKRLICEEARTVACPPRGSADEFDAERNVFVALSKLATLRRFPAGQLDWELSGMPRSWLARVSPRVLPRVAYWIAVRMRGSAPAFFIHLTAHSRQRRALVERESNRSYYRMAQSMARQPQVKGLVASSWLHSPDTMTASPHLTALNRVFLENRALVTTMGPAEPDSGVFFRSPERKRLFDEGRFTPTTGLVLWPRADMLAWAASHPELADSSPLTQ
jgi:hypothetical protein